MRWHLYIVDDPIARRWAPVAETQPVGEIVFGALSLRGRLERATGLVAEGYLAAHGLEGFVREGVPPVVDEGGLPADEALVLLSSRYVPPLSGATGDVLPLPRDASGRVVELVTAGTPIGWLLSPGVERPPLDLLVGMGAEAGSTRGDRRLPRESAAEELEVGGSVLQSIWELVERGGEQLSEDLAELFPDGAGEGATRLEIPPGATQVGADPVSVGEEVVVDPRVVLDTRSGPIHLARGVHVRPFTHLKGPAFIGAESTLLGGLFESLCCGRGCKLRGEISTSVLMDYTNKAHDGYLGHSLVGRWVNLGAMTTNSDLKNNYGPVRVGTSSGEIDTGLLKVGVFLGDHVKTGIGTTLSAGTVVGAGTNLFGHAPPPKWVPAFHWGTGESLVPYRLAAFLLTAEQVMARRGVKLDSAERNFLSRVWRDVHGPRSDA